VWGGREGREKARATQLASKSEVVVGSNEGHGMRDRHTYKLALMFVQLTRLSKEREKE